MRSSATTRLVSLTDESASMVIDTSALVAILTSEPEAGLFMQAIDLDETRLVSAASVLETSIVLGNRYGGDAARELDLLIANVPLSVVPVDIDQLQWARHAFNTYGRGRHPASLNFGDCFTYGLAKATNSPILFKGSDFSRTDLQSAIGTPHPL